MIDFGQAQLKMNDAESDEWIIRRFCLLSAVLVDFHSRCFQTETVERAGISQTTMSQIMTRLSSIREMHSMHTTLHYTTKYGIEKDKKQKHMKGFSCLHWFYNHV